MAYIGNTPGENFISFSKQVFTIVNSQTAYSLDHKVTDENELRLVINNVVQEPGTGKAYTASGNTLTLASALTNGTDEMYCIFLGKARETSTVPDSFITKNKLNLISTSSSAGLEVKGDGSSQDGYLQLNCSQNSHGVKIKSPPHSAGQSYTLTLPQSISADTFLKTDGSGNLSFASAGGITVADQYRVTANITANADPISSNIERIDTSGQGTIGSAMSVSSGVFTFPSTGIYLVTFQGTGYTASGGDNVNMSMSVTTNNSSYTTVDSQAEGNSETRNFSLSGGSLIDVTDTSNVKVRFSVGSIDSGSQFDGNTAENRTSFTFIRLGDT